MKPVASLSVALKPSRRLHLIQTLAHGVAATAVLASAVAPWLAALLLLPIGMSWAIMRHGRPPASLLLREDGRVETAGASGKASTGPVHAHSFVLSFMVVLLYRQQGRSRSLVLLADSIDPEDFRLLRLWLRWRLAAAEPKGALP